MLKRSLVILTEIVVVCVIIFSAILFWASYFVDTEEFKTQFTQVIERLTGMPVSLQGELNVAIYPNISLEIIDLSVGKGPDVDLPLIEFNTLRVSANLMPLFQKKIELRTVVVEGMTVNIVEDIDGKLNWQTVLDRQTQLSKRHPSEEGAILPYSLSGLEVVDATLTYTDLKTGDIMSLSGIDIRTGAIAAGRDVPFSASSRFTWQNGGVDSHFILKGMVKSGDDSTRYRLEDATLYASIGGDYLPEGANPGELTANVVMDWDAKTITLDSLKGRILGLRAVGNVESGNLSEVLNAVGHIEILPFAPREVLERYFPKTDFSNVQGFNSGSLNAHFKVDDQGVDIESIKATLDDLDISGRFSLSNYSDPAYSFNLSAGDVDVDKYVGGTPSDSAEIATWAEVPLDLLQDLNINGDIKLKSLKVASQQYRNVGADIKNGKKGISFKLNTQSKQFKRATVSGALKVSADPETSFSLLSLSADTSVTSNKGGFDFQRSDDFEVTGDGQINATFNVNEYLCTPSKKITDILSHVNGRSAFLLGVGRATLKIDDAKHTVQYSSMTMTTSVDPIKKSDDTVWGFNTLTTLRGEGRGDITSFGMTTNGPLTISKGNQQITSSGMNFKGHVVGKLYTKYSSRLTAHGLAVFDTEKKTLSVSDAMIRTLETTLRGSAQVDASGGKFKSKGSLQIPGANIRRIVYLLDRIHLRTSDLNALRAVSFQSNFDADENGFKLSNLEGKFDGVAFSGSVNGDNYSDPLLRFSLSAGAFDLDRYLPPSTKPSLEEQRAGVVQRSPAVDLPLGFLRMLRLDGKAWFEEFKLAKVRAKGLEGRILANNGKIHVAQVLGTVNNGKLTADWTGQVGEANLVTRLKLHVEDFESGDLLTDVAGREYIKGQGDLDFDLTSTGATDDDIVLNLSGKAWMRVTNGSYKFSGYGKNATTGRNVTSDKKSNDIQPRDRRTTFRRASASFAIKNSEFEIDSLRVEGPPIVQSYGKGRFHLFNNTINVAIRNDFVGVPSITITLSGKLTDPQIRIPKGKIAQDTMKNIWNIPEKSFNFVRDLFK